MHPSMASMQISWDGLASITMMFALTNGRIPKSLLAMSVINDKKFGDYNFYLAYTRYTAWIGFGIEFSLRNLK